MARGHLIAFEGIDASGKSTQARRVAHSRHARLTFEPGDTVLGAALRAIVLDAATPMSPETASLLMLADRAHHVATVIEPELAAGRHVVTDRFLASTLAYQGYGAGVDLELLRRATDLATGSCRPTVTFLLDVPIEVARARRSMSGADRYESAGDDFQDAVRRGYLELAREDVDTWVVLDGERSPEDVAQFIDARLDALNI